MAVDPEDLLSAEAREAAAPVGAPAGRRAHGVQRVQIGLVGLAAMVLLVGLANIIISNARQNQAQVVPEAAPTVAPQEAVAPVSDPLADVGVLPDLPAEASREQASGAVAPVTGDAPPLPQQ
jgi:hypothetical protein